MSDFRDVFIYLVGMPGTGKLTTAREIVRQENFRLIDNHLINNPVFAAVRVDGSTQLPAKVWEHTRAIRNIVLDCIENLSPAGMNFIFTNALAEEDALDRELFKEIVTLADKRRGLFIPVRMHVSAAEHIKRISHPERETNMKETNPDAVARYQQLTVLKTDHPHVLDIDTTDLSPTETAAAILKHVKKTLHDRNT